MSTPTDPTPPPADDALDDQQWFALMAGRAAPDATAATRNDAAWLRAALLAYRAQAPAGAPSAADERTHRLLARARAAGVLPPVPAAPPPAGAAPQRRSGPRWWQPAGRGPAWGWGLAAGLGALALLWQLQDGGWPGQPPAEADHRVLRGDGLQQRTVADPMAERERLLTALRAAGLTDVQPYQRLGRVGLDIALPVPLPEAQAQALRQLGLVPPGGPALQVELLDAAAPGERGR